MKILVAGVGNIFFGDDGFGSEVARRLIGRFPPSVTVKDFGIRTLDLAYEMSRGYDLVIVIDAVRRGGTPGTVYVIEPAVGDSVSLVAPAHGPSLESVFAHASQLGADGTRVVLVGCEPAVIESEDGRLGLSPEVGRAVEEAVRAVEELTAPAREAASRA
jgi:hydrogenase maturation protease